MSGGGTLAVVPATPDRWDDVALLLAGTDDAGCWCQAWRGTAAAYGLPPDTSRPDTLRWQLAEVVPTGFLAYLDDEPAGWCGVAVRSETPRLRTSRTIPAIDDAPVWSIGCLKVRVGYRRTGVARALPRSSRRPARPVHRASRPTRSIRPGRASTWASRSSGWRRCSTRRASVASSRRTRTRRACRGSSSGWTSTLPERFGPRCPS